ENQFFEELVFTNVGGNHLSNLTCLQQLTDAEVVDAGIVADDRQIANAFIAQGENEVFRDSTQAKAAHHDCCAILDVGYGFTRVTHHLVHTKPPLAATLKDITRDSVRMGEPLRKTGDALDEVGLAEMLLDGVNNGASNNGAIGLLPDCANMFRPRN